MDYSLPWRRRLSVQLAAAFVLLFVLFSSALGYSLYLSQQRETDIAVVHTAERLRLLAMSMQQQASNYLRVPARDYGSFHRDVQLYYRDLRRHTQAFEKELGCFIDGKFGLGASGSTARSTYRVNVAAEPTVQAAVASWRTFQAGLQQALGDQEDEPRLEYAAQFVQHNAEQLLSASASLHERFAQTALTRLESGRKASRMVVAAALVLLALTMWWAMRALRPLRAAVAGFQRVARGDLDYRVQTDVSNELGVLTAAFNGTAERLGAIVGLLDGLQQSQDTHAALHVVHRELGVLMPVDWVGLLKPRGEGGLLMEWSGTAGARVVPSRHAPIPEALAQAMQDQAPLRLPELQWFAGPEADANPLLAQLSQRGFHGLMAIPVTAATGRGLLLAASKRPHAYLLEHQELLSNLAPYLAHALARFLTNESRAGHFEQDVIQHKAEP